MRFTKKWSNHYAWLVLGFILWLSCPSNLLDANAGNKTMEIAEPSNSLGNTNSQRGKFYVQERPTPASEIVYVGIEPVSIYGIEVEQGIWNANFYIWWRWSGEKDATDSTQFLNNSDGLSSTKISYSFVNMYGKPEPKILATGEKYQRAYVRMGFTSKFDLSHYPLDSQNLNIQIENTKYSTSVLSYVWDLEHMSAERTVPISGWKSKGFDTGTYVHSYLTDFGYVDILNVPEDFSSISYKMEIERSKPFFYIKLFFPLLIILLAILSSLVVKQLAAQAPLAIASTGILTALFFQQSYSQVLPTNAPVVLIDKIYLLGLLIIILVFTRVVQRARKSTPGMFDKESNHYMGHKSDIMFASALLATFLLGSIILISI